MNYKYLVLIVPGCMSPTKYFTVTKITQYVTAMTPRKLQKNRIMIRINIHSLSRNIDIYLGTFMCYHKPGIFKEIDSSGEAEREHKYE